VSKLAELASRPSAKPGMTNDYLLLEQLCRGAYEFQNGDTLESLLERLFQRHDYRMHTEFAFFRGRSPITYAAMFGQKHVVRILVGKCCGSIDKVDLVRDIGSGTSSRG
jgi:hypothetical protein